MKLLSMFNDWISSDLKQSKTIPVIKRKLTPNFKESLAKITMPKQIMTPTITHLQDQIVFKILFEKLQLA